SWRRRGPRSGGTRGSGGGVFWRLTSVALRAPSVSRQKEKAELSTLLRLGTFYFALTGKTSEPDGRAPNASMRTSAPVKAEKGYNQESASNSSVLLDTVSGARTSRLLERIS